MSGQFKEFAERLLDQVHGVVREEAVVVSKRGAVEDLHDAVDPDERAGNGVGLGEADAPSAPRAAAGSIMGGVPGSQGSPALGPACFTHTPPPQLVNFDVVGAASVVCSVPMQLLEATYELKWNGIVVEQDIRTDSTGVGVGATSPCMPGTYSATLTLDLKWPAEINGPTFYTENSGPFTTTC